MCRYCYTFKTASDIKVEIEIVPLLILAAGAAFSDLQACHLGGKPCNKPALVIRSKHIWFSYSDLSLNFLESVLRSLRELKIPRSYTPIEANWDITSMVRWA